MPGKHVRADRKAVWAGITTRSITVCVSLFNVCRDLRTTELSLNRLKTKNYKRQVSAAYIPINWPAMTEARRLDLIAEFEMSAGRVRQAERLANAAAAIREGAR